MALGEVRGGLGVVGWETGKGRLRGRVAGVPGVG